MMMVLVGKSEEIVLTPETCERNLRGFFLPNVGCIVNARKRHVEKNGDVSIFPLKAKLLPVIVRKEDFKNISTESGSWSNVFTYILK
jgi:hypothetical protein